MIEKRATDRQMYLAVVVAYVCLGLLLTSYDIKILNFLYMFSIMITSGGITRLPNGITDDKSPFIKYVLYAYNDIRGK